MKKEDMEKFTQTIQEKLGKEASSIIADDLGILITDNAQMNNSIQEKESQINKLKESNEKLVTANGNLLQQVGMGEEPPKPNKVEEEPKKVFSFKNAFDKKGKFIK